MARETYKTMVAALAAEVEEIFPWDLLEELESDTPPLLLDIRCPDEFERIRINESINVPRGILEMAVDYGYEETVPMLVEARERRVVVICKSGNRSVLAAHTLRLMGFSNTASLKTGLRGWNDYEQFLVDHRGVPMDFDDVDLLFLAKVAPEQLGPQRIDMA